MNYTSVDILICKVVLLLVLLLPLIPPNWIVNEVIDKVNLIVWGWRMHGRASESFPVNKCRLAIGPHECPAIKMQALWPRWPRPS